MQAQVTSRTDSSVTIQVTIPLEGTMLMVEDQIKDAINDVGLLATEEKLRSFDTLRR